MKSSTPLDSALFQLTPTRTRCDLIITANGKTEKIASGLLNPFLAHLKTAQDQIAKGGYSIILEPKPGCDATWFTKGTLERFVRFVSTPEVLERVYTTESEIIQIGEAIAIQSNNELGLSTVVDHQAKLAESIEGSKPVLDMSEEKAIVLYKPATQPSEANGSTTHEGSSKVQLLKVLETRKMVLQKEQGMAFARAVAAGFDIDHMKSLLSFAECFGAIRLMDACLRFMDLWKSKHETGQWVEIEAAEAISSRSDFSCLNPSGITLGELASENNGKASIDASVDEKPSMDHQVPPGHREYFQGQFPHHMFPPWPIHSPPGAVPVFQPYPMQGMPFYQNYPGNGSFVQPPYLPMEDSRLNNGYRMGQKGHSMDSRDSNTESETWDADASRTRSNYGLELESETSQTPESQKEAKRSGKKKSGMVVIRNINYITSNRHSSSGSESDTDSNGTDEETGDLPMDSSEVKHKSSSKSSKRKENRMKSIDESKLSDKEDRSYEKEQDGGHWQAFQSYLLRNADEDKQSVDQGMFAMEKGVKVKRRQTAAGDDPLVTAKQDSGEIQEGRMTEFHNISGNLTRRSKLSNAELLISEKEIHSGGATGSTDAHLDLQYSKIDGRRYQYRRASNDAFMIQGQENLLHLTSTDPMAINGFEGTTSNLDSISNNMTDESYIIPFRSKDRGEADDRNPIDMDAELPSELHNAENCSNRMRRKINYEPDDLTLMPERGTEKRVAGYDPALEYEMQARGKDAASLANRNKELVANGKQGPKKSDKDRRPKVSPDTLDKKKTVGAARKGKPSKLSPLDEARARAERLRTFKADLQREKREKEEEEMKRKETLKMERQKRIAARSSSIPAQSPLSSQQTKKRLLSKPSPSSVKGSKFSDSEPGSLSPLQRFPVRTASLGSGDSQKVSKPRRISNSGRHSADNRLSRSVSALPESKKESNVLTPEPKVSMARIRRLSEPKMSSSPQVSSVKPRSAESVSKPKISDGPESKKISAIINLDRTKGASLPELKIRTNVVQKKSAAKEVNLTKSSGAPVGAELKREDDKISTPCDVEENPVVEKMVVMLECEKPSVPVEVSQEKMGAEEGQHDNCEVGGKAEVVSGYTAIRAPPSPIAMDGIDKEPIECRLQEQSSRYKAGSVTMHATGQLEGDLKLPSIKIAEKPYKAPFARNSSLEDPCTENSEYGKAHPTNLETATTGKDTVKALISDFKDVKLEKIPEEKAPVKEAKGFRRLLKFGRKSHTTAAGDQYNESDNGSINGSEADEYASNAASTSEVHTLKNLISQDETPTAGTTAQKSSRSFSLLSPFRSKTSDKKVTA